MGLCDLLSGIKLESTHCLLVHRNPVEHLVVARMSDAIETDSPQQLTALRTLTGAGDALNNCTLSLATGHRHH